MPTVTSLDHLVLTVNSIEATVGFYETVLGMTSDIFVGTDGTRRVALMFGSQKINLHQVGREFDPKSKHPTSGSGDLCFLSHHAIDDWVAHLTDHLVTIEEGPIQRTGARGPILSVYVRDPDQNLIEISQPLY